MAITEKTAVAAVGSRSAPSGPPRRRQISFVLVLGLVTTVAATITAVLARGTIADHVRSGYPTYSPDEIDTATTTYVTYLVILGALGVLGWALALWAARNGTAWSRWLTAGLWLAAAGVALLNLTVRDTSGDTGLPAAISGMGLVPLATGLIAVVLMWRRTEVGDQR